MRRTVQRWGNSLGLRLPIELARDLGLDAGVEVELVSDGVTLTVRPLRGAVLLAELIGAITADNKHPATDASGPRGLEAW